MRAEGTTTANEQRLRSLLFVPGSDTRKLGKIPSLQDTADVVVIDLEDAVADEQKSAARAITHDAVPSCAAGGSAIAVRVNSPTTGRMEADIEAVVRAELAGIMVPKIEALESLAAADETIAAAERRQGLETGKIWLLALIETARGLVECERILMAAPPRTLTAVFGAGDFSTELGIELTRDAEELAYARSRLVTATRAAGLPKPVDGPWLDLEDEEGLVADCERSRRLGFQGRVTVYPPQVDTVLRAYSRVPEVEVERARRLVEAFEEAERRGVASIRVDGKFVDYPIYNLAQERLRLHAAYAELEANG